LKVRFVIIFSGKFFSLSKIRVEHPFDDSEERSLVRKRGRLRTRWTPMPGSVRQRNPGESVAASLLCCLSGAGRQADDSANPFALLFCFLLALRLLQ
jgi:hypothetical protein